MGGWDRGGEGVWTCYPRSYHPSPKHAKAVYKCREGKQLPASMALPPPPNCADTKRTLMEVGCVQGCFGRGRGGGRHELPRSSNKTSTLPPPTTSPLHTDRTNFLRHTSSE